jgi:hypothetical protein
MNNEITTKYFEFLKKLENETPDSVMNKLMNLPEGKNWRGEIDLTGTLKSHTNLDFLEKIDPILIPILAKDGLAGACYLYRLILNHIIHPARDGKSEILKQDNIRTFLKLSLENIKKDSFACYILISLRFDKHSRKSIFEDYRQEFEQIISKDARSSYFYAVGDYISNNDNPCETFFIIRKNNGRFKLGEKEISQNGYWAYWYAKNILKRRWDRSDGEIGKVAEDNIANCRLSPKNYDILFPALYAELFIPTGWEEAEKTISTHAESSLRYAKMINKEFPAGEEQISKNTTTAFDYAKLINKRFELGEQAISKDAKLSFLYARDIIEGRFELAEPTIMTDPEITLQYAIEVVGGQLPEDMHNQMIGKKLAA